MVGAELLCGMGVYPFVLPLRPIPGTALENLLPPHPDYMHRVYSSVAEIMKRKDTNSSISRAGCVRCGSCSSIKYYED